MTVSTAEITYSHRPRTGLGLSAWAEMGRELWASRELTWRLFQRDFSARYRQSVLGYLWAVVPVLVAVATFTWLNRAKVLPIAGTVLPYPVFLLLGLTVWQLFASGLTSATQSLVNAGSLIAKINFPRETLVLAATGQALVEFLIRAALVALAFALYRTWPPWTIVLVPFAVIPLCLFTIGLGYVCALGNGILRDTGQTITLVLTFWMFLTPVVYPPPSGAGATLVNVLNPISPFVIAAQDLATHGYLTQPGGYASACAAALVVFLLGWRVFHLTEPRIAERV
ncbi:MAG: ABC transporter permease [Deltaproteobacteria bacterium]|nr:ABC transporter permease [Deltaproteobacteria bacterium]